MFVHTKFPWVEGSCILFSLEEKVLDANVARLTEEGWDVSDISTSVILTNNDGACLFVAKVL